MESRTSSWLIHQRTGARLRIPSPPKVGLLRSAGPMSLMGLPLGMLLLTRFGGRKRHGQPSRKQEQLA